ncbi:MAG: hypothetical protein FWF05_09480 [Oscillospiraceae bacterium]|nr:hypothetical protein [Oscillospiraceae bacterium]
MAASENLLKRTIQKAQEVQKMSEADKLAIRLEGIYLTMINRGTGDISDLLKERESVIIELNSLSEQLDIEISE